MKTLADRPLTLWDLPPSVQEAALDLREAFRDILQRGGPADPQLKLLAATGRDGWSLGNLQKKFKAWRGGRDDLVLVDKRLFPKLQKILSDRRLPQDFLEWAGGQMLGNQRKSRPAYRDLILRWQTWRRTGDSNHAIPGYDEPPVDCGKGYPSGWSYGNLMREAQPPRVEIVIARQGTAAAKKFLPLVHSTREGVRWLEWVFFDDLMRDRNIIVNGYRDPVRILQFGALDYGSACYLKFGMRPDLPRKDGVRDRLKRRDFLFLVASLLTEYGYPLDYVMHMVVERGTATMNQAEARTLYDLSNGQIQVGYSSMEGQFVLAWEEAKSGNSDAKGPLEAFHNLWHNYEASHNGAVGKDRDHRPASLYGGDREAVALNKAGLLLTPGQRGQLRLPYATWNEAFLQTIDLSRRINSRRDHDLEGTDKVLLWRHKNTDMEWMPEAALAGLDPDQIRQLDWMPVNESPVERALKLSNGVRVGMIPPGALVRFYEDSHTAAKVNGVDASIKIEGRVYYFGPETPEEAIADREEITLHHAPINPTHAIVTHKGICVGTWKRRRAPRGDSDALSAEIRRKHIFLNTAVGSVRGKMAEKLAEEHRRMDHNLDVLANAGLVPSDAVQTLAAGKQVVRTSIADGMQRATDTIRARATAEKAASRLARIIGADAADDMLGEPESTDLPAPVSEEIPW